jgi:hypothetical protein
MPPVDPVVPPTGLYSPFPPQGGEGSFQSAGDVDIWWREPTALEVFDYKERRKSAYHYFGSDTNTTVWRSAPLVAGSQADTYGTIVGPVGSTIAMSRSRIRMVPQVAMAFDRGQGQRRRIFAELHSLEMRGKTETLLAGEPFRRHLQQELGLTDAQVSRVFERSFGEVTSWDLSGDPKSDFPADNHFNVFFGIAFDKTADYPAFTIFNKEPLVVVDLGITSLPPLGRVTIPQFPYDLPEFYFVKDPKNERTDVGVVICGRGGCCAHSVRGDKDLGFRPLDFSELASSTAETFSGLALRSSAPVQIAARSDSISMNKSQFRRLRQGYVDGVFVPNGETQITSTGIVFRFEDTTSGGATDSVRSGVAFVDRSGQSRPISVEAPTSAVAYQPPQPIGVGLGANAGITFDIAAIRQEHPDFYPVSLVALQGLNGDSPLGSSVRLRVLLDGVSVGFADNTFTHPGQSKAISVDLQTVSRFVTICGTSQNHGCGVFALFQIRGFGNLKNDPDLPYSGPARPTF